MFEDLSKLWSESGHLIFAGVAVSVIVGILVWATKVPARLKKRWKTKTGKRDHVYMALDGEIEPPPRRPKNRWCALLLFFGSKNPDLWKK